MRCVPSKDYYISRIATGTVAGLIPSSRLGPLLRHRRPHVRKHAALLAEVARDLG
jgi:hypothetical protein